MAKMIAYCGEVCSDCLAFIATKNDDEAKRQEVAALWSRKYHHGFKPEDINCDGCLAEGERLFVHCHHCEVRTCGREKGVVNCAHCEDYPCAELDQFFGIVPANKNTLDEIKKGL